MNESISSINLRENSITTFQGYYYIILNSSYYINQKNQACKRSWHVSLQNPWLDCKNGLYYCQNVNIHIANVSAIQLTVAKKMLSFTEVPPLRTQTTEVARKTRIINRKCFILFSYFMISFERILLHRQRISGILLQASILGSTFCGWISEQSNSSLCWSFEHLARAP